MPKLQKKTNATLEAVFNASKADSPAPFSHVVCLLQLAGLSLLAVQLPFLRVYGVEPSCALKAFVNTAINIARQLAADWFRNHLHPKYPEPRLGTSCSEEQCSETYTVKPALAVFLMI